MASTHDVKYLNCLAAFRDDLIRVLNGYNSNYRSIAASEHRRNNTKRQLNVFINENRIEQTGGIIKIKSIICEKLLVQ